MLASPPELPSTGSLMLETSHFRRCRYSSRQHWRFWSGLWSICFKKHNLLTCSKWRVWGGRCPILRRGRGFHIVQDFNILNTLLDLILIMFTKQILNQFFTLDALLRFLNLLPSDGPQEQDKVSE